MKFHALSVTERGSLHEALNRNAHDNCAILMDRRDTSFKGYAEEVTDEEVITAIKSVPTHY